MGPFVVPDVLKYMEHRPEFPDSTAVWSDAAVWVPWTLWQAYGDRDALARQYPAMTAHARRVEGLLSDTGLWDTGFQFGDWLDPQAPPDAPFKAKADNGVVATACYHRTLREVAAAAEVLGNSEDAATSQHLPSGSAALSRSTTSVTVDGCRATAQRSMPWPSSSACSMWQTGRVPGTGWRNWCATMVSETQPVSLARRS